MDDGKTSEFHPHIPGSLLRNSQFVLLLTYRTFIILSYQIVAVAVGWHIYQLTRDPLALGLIGLAEVLPYFGCALFAGYLVDYLPRRKIGIAASIGLMFSALILLAIVSGAIPAGTTTFPTITIYLAIALNGIVRSFLRPVNAALFARVLHRKDYSRGTGISTVMMQIALVVGPAIGGLLIGFSGEAAAYGTASILAFIAAMTVATLRVTEPVKLPQRAPVFKSIGEGLQFVWKTKVLFGAQALDMFSVLFGGAVALLPAFITDVLHTGPESLGLLRAAPAVGSILIGIWLSLRPPEACAGYILFGAVVGFGICIIGFALSGELWLSALLLMLSGCFDSASVVIRTTIMQLSTPEGMRGRVSAINGIFIGSSNELGALESGVAARLIGLVPSVIFGGCMTLGIAGITAKLVPKLRRLDLRQLY